LIPPQNQIIENFEEKIYVEYMNNLNLKDIDENAINNFEIEKINSSSITVQFTEVVEKSNNNEKDELEENLNVNDIDEFSINNFENGKINSSINPKSTIIANFTGLYNDIQMNDLVFKYYFKKFLRYMNKFGSLKTKYKIIPLLLNGLFLMQRAIRDEFRLES